MSRKDIFDGKLNPGTQSPPTLPPSLTSCPNAPLSPHSKLRPH